MPIPIPESGIGPYGKYFQKIRRLLYVFAHLQGSSLAM
jgi:hypothetical protein